MRLVNDMAAAILNGPVTSVLLSLFCPHFHSSEGLLCLSVPDILPNLEPEALNPRETQMNLEEDESGMCWPCAGSGGKQAMGGDEKPRPQGKAGCK